MKSAGMPAAVATPTPSPTPEPPRLIEGQMVLKLARGNDVASGVGVVLLDGTKFETALVLGAKSHNEAQAERAATLKSEQARLEAERQALIAELAAAEGNLRERLLNGLRKLREESGGALASGASLAPRVENLATAEGLDKLLVALEPLSQPQDALARWQGIISALADKVATLRQRGQGQRADILQRLEHEKELYDGTYRHRPATAEQSLKRQADYERSLTDNPHDVLAGLIEKAVAAGAEAPPDLAPDLALRVSAWEAGLGLLAQQTREAAAQDRSGRLETLWTAIEEAKLDRVFANDKGVFKLSAVPGVRPVLFSTYIDPGSSTGFAWLYPARAGVENNLTSYNALAKEEPEGLQGYAALLGGEINGADVTKDLVRRMEE